VFDTKEFHKRRRGEKDEERKERKNTGERQVAVAI
jgi:hypothetical protein